MLKEVNLKDKEEITILLHPTQVMHKIVREVVTTNLLVVTQGSEIDFLEEEVVTPVLKEKKKKKDGSLRVLQDFRELNAASHQSQ
jgi:hypothetical protein